MSLAYYNENDPYCAQWLRNLLQQKLIAPGVVDERSILDVKPYELEPYTQCHFFAGIGGWSRALRLAGVADHREIWTGSCPCQPFSVAGSRRGFADDRDLWPFWKYLIAQRRPATIFGEQVASAADWLARTRNDLEKMDYAVGCMPIEAASCGAAQLRDRYWFVADYDEQRQGDGSVSSGSILLEYAAGDGWGEGWTEHEFRSRGFTASVASLGGFQFIECPDGKLRRLPPPGVCWLGNAVPSRVAKLRAFGNAIVPQVAAEFIKAALG
jgi:DNA (cytosine-5)-methyltransferase 1